MARWRHEDVNKLPKEVEGFQNLYECWIFPKNGADPLCLLVAELPPGIEPAMDYTPAKNVTFAGYYFKLMQYESAAPNPNEPTRNQIRRAPLLMGRSFVVVPEPERPPTGTSMFVDANVLMNIKKPSQKPFGLCRVESR